MTGVPRGTVRADLIETQISPQALAAIAPQLAPSPVLLAGGTAPPPLLLAEVEGQRIRNLGQLHSAVEHAAQLERPVRVAVGSPTAGVQSSAEVTGVALANLFQATAENHPAIAVSEEGNPWLLLRRGPARCKVLTPRRAAIGAVACRPGDEGLLGTAAPVAGRSHRRVPGDAHCRA